MGFLCFIFVYIRLEWGKIEYVLVCVWMGGKVVEFGVVRKGIIEEVIIELRYKV